MVEQSITRAPSRNRRSAASSTSSTCRPLGSIVMTTLAPSTAAAGAALARNPACSARPRAAALTSKQRTSCPASFRRRAIGNPMLPSPMNPMIAMGPPISSC
jgi:hypothetical protein